MGIRGPQVQGLKSGVRSVIIPHSTLPTPYSKLRTAFTLLEVILALALAVVVIGLVGLGVHSVLKIVDGGRLRTERDQLARAILHRIADDLRGTIRYEPFDDSGLSSANSAASAAASALTGGASQSQNQDGEGNAAGDDSGSNSANSNSASSGNDSSQNMLGETSSLIPGIYGSQTYLQIDVGRIPRFDEFAAGADGLSMPVPASDVRRVAYYVGGASSMISGGNTALGTSRVDGGLIRQELNQASAQWAAEQGDPGMLDQYSSLLAPEALALEFRYFDGTQWLNEWDSTANGGLPRAVEIILVLQAEPNAVGLTPGLTPNDADNVYQLIVHLPASDPVPQATTEPMTSDETAPSENPLQNM